MVQLIVGPKGSGKTVRLVDELNRLASEKRNVVCIQPQKRLDNQIKYNVRLIDSSEYPVKNPEELLGFVAGICAKDYDLEALYIDSVHKVAHTRDKEQLLHFIQEAEALSTKDNFHLVLTWSVDKEELDERFHKYLV